MAGRKQKKPGAFHDAMKVKSGKKKGGKVRGSRGEQSMKDRKNTLLVEYKKLRKANSFVDNRIGEKEKDLDPEEKALMRFRAQRMKRGREDKFNLVEDGGLGGVMGFGRDQSEDEDDGNALGDEILKEIKEGLPHGQGQRKKSKREVMREVITKSKLHRHEKAREFEENFEKKIELDEQFQNLLEHTAFADVISNPADVARQQAISHPGPTTTDDQFDNLLKQLSEENEVAKATDRTQTQEEIDATKERNLERERVKKEKRMMAFSDDEDLDLDSEEDSQDPESSQKSKRIRHMQESVPGGDDDDDGVQYDTEEINEISALEQRRQIRASGDDPLQVSFRKLTEKLMKRYSKKEDRGESESNSSGKGSSDDGSGESDDDYETPEDDKDGSSATTDILLEGLPAQSNDSSAEVAFPQKEHSQVREEASTKPATPKETQISDEGLLSPSQKGVSSDLDSGQDTHSGYGKSKSVHFVEELNTKHDNSTNGNMGSPLLGVYPVPESYQEFSGWATGRSSTDVRTIISKIRTGNHSELNAAVKMKLEALFSIVLEHFGTLASANDIQICDLDGLIAPLCDMAREIPLHAARVARQELQQMQGALSNSIEGSNSHSEWPTRRSILVMRLISIIFPVSDRFHAATTPLALLVSQYLAQCSVVEPHHIAVGLFMTTFALWLAAPAKRFSPEPLAFIMMTIRQCIPGSAQDLLLISHSDIQCNQEDELTVEQLLTMAPDSEYFKSNAFKLAAIQLVLHCLAQYIELNRKSISFPEVFAPIVPTLQELSSMVVLPQRMKDMLGGVIDTITKISCSTSRSRKPLVQNFRLATPEVKQFNPRLQVANTYRSSDPDMKEMKKKLNRERRGAMKELRKDAVFMSRVRQSEKNKVDKERLESEKRFYKELNAFEQDMRSGGQKGMNPHLKKRKR